MVNDFLSPWETSVSLGTVTGMVLTNAHWFDLIKDGDIVLDIGANMGIFSVLVANKYPHATVYAFEPTPTTFEALQKKY